jgi:hypothetical protein
MAAQSIFSIAGSNINRLGMENTNLSPARAPALACAKHEKAAGSMEKSLNPMNSTS